MNSDRLDIHILRMLSLGDRVSLRSAESDEPVCGTAARLHIQIRILCWDTCRSGTKSPCIQRRRQSKSLLEDASRLGFMLGFRLGAVCNEVGKSAPNRLTDTTSGSFNHFRGLGAFAEDVDDFVALRSGEVSKPAASNVAACLRAEMPIATSSSSKRSLIVVA